MNSGQCPYRPDLPPRPKRIAALPVNEQGYPIPWFSPIVDGKPDLRFSDKQKFYHALSTRRCWVCGWRLGMVGTFVGGPLSALGGISSEPPSHPTCARYSVMACPFLTRPKASRRSLTSGLPRHAVGNHQDGNPGISMLWTTSEWRTGRAEGGHLIVMGKPFELEWWTLGRKATRPEVEEALEIAVKTYIEHSGDALGEPGKVRDALLAVSTFAEESSREDMP